MRQKLRFNIPAALFLTLALILTACGNLTDCYPGRLHGPCDYGCFVDNFSGSYFPGSYHFGPYNRFGC